MNKKLTTEETKELKKLHKQLPWSYETLLSCYEVWEDLQGIKRACLRACELNISPIILLGVAREITDPIYAKAVDNQIAGEEK